MSLNAQVNLTRFVNINAQRSSVGFRFNYLEKKTSQLSGFSRLVFFLCFQKAVTFTGYLAPNSRLQSFCKRF